MAFTFQINSDIEFKHDKVLLEKAEKYRPKINKKSVYPEKIVDICEDSSKLNGYYIKDSAKQIDKIKEYGMSRDDVMILDLGNHYVGKFSVDIDSVGSPMDAPLYMRLKFAEMPCELEFDSKDYDGWLSKSWIQEEFIHIDHLPAKLELPRRYSCRYIEIKIIDTSPKWKAVFSNPVFIAETSADYSKLKNIDIKDKELKNIYDVSVKTLADCMQDVFEDGPKRDRRLWLGDLRLQALANYSTFNNLDLVKRCLYLFAAMPTTQGKIPANVFVSPQNVPDDTFLFEYSLFFISTLYDYQRNNFDKELLDELYPVAKTQIDLTLKMVNEDGELLTDESYPVFVDWSNDFDKTTAGQAELIYVLKQFIYLAKQVNDNDISKYENMLNKLVDYSKNNLYDKDKKLFVSGVEKEYNIASQVWMVLANVMSKDENSEIMHQMINNLFPVKGIATPYMYHCIVEAMFEAGLKDEAVTLMKDYWGTMIKLGADTFWEAFEPANPDYSPYGSPIVNSYCHAWSCTPVYLIDKYL